MSLSTHFRKAPRLLAASLFAATCCIALPGANAQTPYPAKPISVIVPFTPGGGTDIATRLVVDRMAKDNGWNFVVENRPGASGMIGMQLLSKAGADGYTIGMGQTANIAINPSLYKQMPYDPLKDPKPVALVAEQAVVLVVSAHSPYHSVAELVAAAKAKPGKLTMASASTGTVGHLAGELFGRRAGFTFVHVPYKGAASGLTDLIGGQTDFMFPSTQAAQGLIKDGKLRALAVTSAKRVPILPDVPTLAESGYPGFEAVDWKALVAPAGTPPAVIEHLHDAVEKVLGEPEFVARLQAEGSVPMPATIEQAKQLFQKQEALWGQLIRDAKIKRD